MAELVAGVVHVVDDNCAVCDSLRLLLNACGFDVRTYTDAAAFLTAIPPGPACLLTDINMPAMDGLELQHHLQAGHTDLSIIVMTGDADVDKAVRAMKSGAIDFLQKPVDETPLISAVSNALAASAHRVAARQSAQVAAARLARLTKREAEVFALLVAGHPTKAIASSLAASPRTIEVHRARVMEKLAVTSLADLVRLSLTASGQPGDPGRD